MSEPLMYRLRFFAGDEDFRPVKWPPPGPFWCSGYRASDDNPVVVAYVAKPEQVSEYWPEATDIEESGDEQPQPVTFTDRFPRPDWWMGAAA